MTMTIRAVILAAAIIGMTMADERKPILVGVLEHPQCKDPGRVAVRALFRRDATGWTALDSAEAARGVDLSNLEWTVAFDGRSLGRVKTVDPGYDSPRAWGYPRDRLLTVVREQSVPRIVNKDARFGGWCDEPPDRPLVLVSEPHFRDPAGWKPLRPDPAYRNRLFQAFRKQVDEVKNCPGMDDVPVPFEYRPDDLVLHRGYRDRSGKKLIAIGLNPDANHCDGPPGPKWSAHWFLLRGDGVQYLGPELDLADAGDYDGDGRSELIFWSSGYNRDGYSLFYDDFNRRVDFLWGYT